MRHSVDGRKFGRNTSHRVAMLRNLANCVIEREQVITTVQKAKEARRVVDRLVTLGKQNTLHSRRLAFDRTRNDLVVQRLFSVLADRYKSRNGGYTRILKISDRRWGDAAEMAVLELVDHPVLDRKRKPRSADAAAKNAEGAEGGAGTQQAKDPFNRFRKLFSGKGGKGGKASGGKGKGKSGAAMAGGSARKTGGGGGKSGGSSSS